jgi:hypothetical protein
MELLKRMIELRNAHVDDASQRADLGTTREETQKATRTKNVRPCGDHTQEMSNVIGAGLGGGSVGAGVDGG